MLGPLLAFGVLMLLPGEYDAVFVVSTAFAFVGLAVLVLLVPAAAEEPGRRHPGDVPGPTGAASDHGDARAQPTAADTR